MSGRTILRFFGGGIRTPEQWRGSVFFIDEGCGRNVLELLSVHRVGLFKKNFFLKIYAANGFYRYMILKMT